MQHRGRDAPGAHEVTDAMNRVLLMGRLTREPELRTTAAGKAVTTFTLVTHEFAGGREQSEFHSIVAWERLAETCGRYLGKGSQVLVEGRLSTRSWDDASGERHWRTEIVASTVEMLGRRAAPVLDAGSVPGPVPELDEAALETAEAFA
jgi:single-strand DNA-binding protein